MRAILARSLMRLASWLPLPACHALGALLGRALYRFSDRYPAIARKNIARCFPAWGEAQREALVKTACIETGKTLLESGALWLWSIPRVMATVRQVSGLELLKQGLAAGKGVIIAAPHLGAWEMVGLYCSLQGPMTSLYRPPRLQGLDDFIRGGRERAGASLVPTDASGVRALYKALERDEIVGILPDQDPGSDGGVFADFFGVPANTMTLLSRLARKSAARVLFVYAERLPRGRGYHLHILPADDTLSAVDLKLAARSLNQGVEACVLRLPAQYQWIYDRYKTRPPETA